MEIDEKTRLEQQYNQHQPQNDFGTPSGRTSSHITSQTSGQTPGYTSGQNARNPRDYRDDQGPKVLCGQALDNLNQGQTNRRGNQIDPRQHLYQHQPQKQHQYQQRDDKNRSGTPPSVDDEENFDATIVPKGQPTRGPPRTGPGFNGYDHAQQERADFENMNEINPQYGNDQSNTFGTRTSESVQYDREPPNSSRPQPHSSGRVRVLPNHSEPRDDYRSAQFTDVNGQIRQPGMVRDHPEFNEPSSYEVITSPRSDRHSPNQIMNEHARNTSSPKNHRPFQEENLSHSQSRRPNGPDVAAPRKGRRSTNTSTTSVSSEQSLHPLFDGIGQPPSQPAVPPPPQSPLQPVLTPPLTPLPTPSVEKQNNRRETLLDIPVQDMDLQMKYKQAINDNQKLQYELKRTREDAQRQIQYERQAAHRLTCKYDS